MNIFHVFESRSSVLKTLFIYYALTVWCFYCEYSWVSSYKANGQFIVRYRGHFSIFEGDGAISTIYGMKFLACFFLVISFYYTISTVIYLFKDRKNDKIDKKNFSDKDSKYEIKLLYFLFWSILVVSLYNYFALDSIIAFVFLTLPVLILTLFLPLFALDIWLNKKKG